MHKLIFWFLIAWTILSLILFLRGYELLDSVVVVLVIDLIALGLIVEVGKKKPFKEINEQITSRIENIEKVCQSILNSSGEDSLMSRIEERLSRQKEDANYLFDRMSRKMLELEERINKFGFNLAEHVENFGVRMEKLENPGEEFPIGETVYVEDEETEEKEES